MKKILLSLLLGGAASVAFAQSPEQGQAGLNATITGRPGAAAAATGQVQTQTAKPQPPAAARVVPTEGAVQEAIRTGQPLQMINPAAPARFGSGQQHVVHDPRNPGKPKGISLFAFTF